jgi:HK97 gp10 family phage protein
MSNAFSVDLAGLDGLTQTLEAMDREMQGKLLNSLVWAASQPVEVEIKRLAPVLTGTLKSQIGWKRGKRKANEKSLVLHLGKAGYGWIVERGSPHAAARPFIRPAFDSKRGAGELAAQAVLDKWVRELGDD